MSLADWAKTQNGNGGGGGSPWNPLGSIQAMGKSIGNKIGNPLDWGKNPIDPNEAQLQDGAYLRDYIKGRLGGLDQRAAPQVGAANIATGPQAQWRQQQMALAGQLSGIASGQRMGAGELATRRQMSQGIAAQLAQAAAQRGGMAGLAGRAAARGIGQMSTDAAGLARQAALQDQSSAQGLLAGLAGQGRQQDIGLATDQAGLDQQATLANQAAKLQQMGMNDAAIAQMLGQLYGVSAAEMAAKLGVLQANQSDTGILGDLMQMGGTLGGAYLSRPGG